MIYYGSDMACFISLISGYCIEFLSLFRTIEKVIGNLQMIKDLIS